MIVTWTAQPTAATTVEVWSVADVDAELASTRVLLAHHLAAPTPATIPALRYLGRRRDALLDARLELAVRELRSSWWDLPGQQEPAWPWPTGQEVAS